jgi:hypothetical protein
MGKNRPVIAVRAGWQLESYFGSRGMAKHLLPTKTPADPI